MSIDSVLGMRLFICHHSGTLVECHGHIDMLYRILLLQDRVVVALALA
jgi:hypothetical protein